MVKHSLFLVSGLALALAACGDDTDIDERVVGNPAATEAALVLTPAQQANLDRFDEAAFQTEYGGYRDEIIRVEGDPPAQGTATGAANTETGMSGATGSPAPEPASAEAGVPSANGLRPRSQMDFAYLDRNDDGQLSVGEYAIWAVPVDPNDPKRNDATKPYLTSEQANQAAQSFFYYDTDGNTYLSRSELEAAMARGAG